MPKARFASKLVADCYSNRTLAGPVKLAVPTFLHATMPIITLHRPIERRKVVPGRGRYLPDPRQRSETRRHLPQS